ncbi:MAG: acyl-CoA dehydrogenase family protein [bacterium]
MKSDNFLANLYMGLFDENRFSSSRAEELEEATDAIISAYREAIQPYPPELIEKEGALPQALIRRFGEIGLFGLIIPEEYGGRGLRLTQYIKIVREMAKVDLAPALVSLAHLSIGIMGVILFGNESQKRRYLVPGASGERIFAYALTEPMTGSDAKNIQSRAELSEDGTYYTLNGEKTYITNANYAKAFTVFAQLDPARPGHMGAFIVERDWEGVSVGKDMPKMGLAASSTAAVRFEDVRVPSENLLGRPGDGFKIAMAILNYGRLGLGVASAAAMEQSLKDMVKRATSRRQFGVPLSHFELIQEKLVKARVHGFVAAAMVDFVARALEFDPVANVALESSHCKLYGTTRAWETLYDALQVAGGSGYISTQPYGKRLRDFRVTTVFEGTTEIHTIYPALFALRKLAREMESSGRGRISGLTALLKAAARRERWPLAFEDRLMRKAARLAQDNFRSIRRMLCLGLLVYGKDIEKREFLLRRITHLSVDAFGILTALATVRAEKQAGRSVDEALEVLAYFLEEAKEGRKANVRLFANRKEVLHAVVFKRILGGAAVARAQPQPDAVQPPAIAPVDLGSRAA